MVKNNLKISAVIFAAGPSDNSLVPLSEEKKGILLPVLADFLPADNIKEKFLKLTSKIFAIYGNKDHIFPLDNLKKFAKELKAKEVFIVNRGHFGSKDNLPQMPEIFEIIREL